jgi:WD40 repeat protein
LWGAADQGKPRWKGTVDGWPAGLALSHDGRALVVGGGSTTARLWDLAVSPPRHHPLPHVGEVRAVAFHDNDQTIVTGTAVGGGEGEVWLWDRASGQPKAAPLPHQGPIHAVFPTADGRSLDTVSRGRTTRLWRTSLVEPGLRVLPNREQVRSVAFLPGADGTLAVAGSGGWKGKWGEVRLWDLKRPSGSRTLTHASSVYSMAVRSDGKVLVGCHDGRAWLWDAATGKGKELSEPHADFIGSAAISPSTDRAATGSEDKTVRLRKLSSGRAVRPPLTHPQPVDAVAFSPDGQKLLTGCGDGNAYLWEIEPTVKRSRTLRHPETVVAVAFSPDGRTLATGCWDRLARIWEVKTGRLLRETSLHAGPVRCLVFSADGRRLLTGCSVTGTNRGEARLWDAASGRPLGPPLWHPGGVRSVALHPDGMSLLTGCEDGNARLWPVTAPEEEDVDRLLLRLQVWTGLELDAGGAVRLLEAREWRRRWLRVHE